MFGLFKKGNNKGKGSLKPVSPEGEQISKPISGSVQGSRRFRNDFQRRKADFPAEKGSMFDPVRGL